MDHSAEQPETPGEPAVWERPLPWLRESENGTTPTAAPTPDARPEPSPASEPPYTEPESQPGTTADGANAPAPTGESTPVPSPTADDGSEPRTASGRSGRILQLATARLDSSSARNGRASGEAQPERSAQVVGAAVAASVLLALGLGTAAFVMVPGDDDSGPSSVVVGDGAAPKVTLGASTGSSGSPSPSATGSDRPGHGKNGTKSQGAKAAQAGGGSSTAANSGTKGGTAGTGTGHAADTGTGTGGGSGSTPTKKATSKPATTSQSTIVAGDAVVGYASSKCIEISAHKGADGSPLQLWGCDGKAWQKWVFKSDGSVRSMGKCLDIADASQTNGAAIQLATCNGGWAQRFNLNGSHDLVNTVIGKCVDAKDQGTKNGTRLQLWDCDGTSNQKWHLG
ncbi:ricin-type beta-trefoil lectin domain protein [Streptomyces sp. NPDC051642]|uniref:ricin-type beta-trefoil lectin domain protein n=1 Tax=Streptomyces sp. NPDC051642 TaxID=3154646 RepID=UPI00341D5F7B